jgi:putative SOS response-associated peptidase YedK
MKDREPYAFAGLWERWKDRKAEADLLTFAVITTDPNEVVQPMHDRMPVIILERDYGRWLDVADKQRLPLDLLRPFDSDKMTAWKVDKAVGNVKNDSPELLRPDNVIEMPEPWTEEELKEIWEVEGKLGLFNRS